MSNFDLYQTVTDQIIAMLDTGVVPWRSPMLGQHSAGHPNNLDSKKPYRGINIFLLAFTAYAKGYGSSYWLTFNQAKERGGAVKKGEKSSLVVFWKQYEAVDKHTGEPAKIPVLRYYNVFNAEQVEGIEIPDIVKFEPLDFHPIEAAEAMASSYEGGPAVSHDGSGQAFYRPCTDSVHMPDRTRFTSSEGYYSTLFHELSHSTAHSARLDRKIDTDPKPFGCAYYGKEELIAEMSAAFLCGQAGIQPAVIENQGGVSSRMVQATERRQEASHLFRWTSPACGGLDFRFASINIAAVAFKDRGHRLAFFIRCPLILRLGVNPPMGHSPLARTSPI